jgi:hypothetical protein
MPTYLGVLKCRGGWCVAEVDVRRGQRDITLKVLRSRPRKRGLSALKPEDVYASLQGGRPMLDPRRTLLGRKERWKLVQTVYPGLPMPKPPRGMSEADVLDVLILAWAAEKRSAGPAAARFRLVPSGA